MGIVNGTEMIVLLDMVKMSGFLKGRNGIQIPSVGPEVGEISQTVAVATKTIVIGRIEASQADIETDVRVPNPVAKEETRMTQSLLQLIQTGKELVVSCLIGCLTTCKTSLVDPVIDVLENDLIQLVNLISQVIRIEVWSPLLMQGPPIGLPNLEQVVKIIIDQLTGLEVNDGWYREAALIIRLGLEVDFTQIMNAQNRILTIGI